MIKETMNSITSMLNNANLANQFKMKKDQSNVVKNILNCKTENGVKYYLLEWANGDIPTWEPSENVSDYTIKCYNIVQTFNANIHNNVNPRKAIVYNRVSSENDTSIDTQKAFNLQYCKNVNMQLSKYAEDNGVSGNYCSTRKMMKNLNTELGYILQDINSQYALIVYSVDRLGRHAASVLNILQSIVNIGAEVVFVKENITWNANTPSHIKKMVEQLIIDSEHLSNLTREKVQNSINRLKAQGHYFGKAPFGYKVVKTVGGIRKKTKCDEQQNTIKLIKKLYCEYANTPIDDIVINPLTYTKRFLTKKEIHKKVCDTLNGKNLKFHNNLFKTHHIVKIMNTHYY